MILARISYFLATILKHFESESKVHFSCHNLAMILSGFLLDLAMILPYSCHNLARILP